MVGKGSNPGPGPYLNPPPPPSTSSRSMYTSSPVYNVIRQSKTNQYKAKRDQFIFAIAETYFTGFCGEAVLHWCVVTNRQWYMYHDLMNDMVNTHYTLKIYIFNQIIN